MVVESLVRVREFLKSNSGSSNIKEAFLGVKNKAAEIRLSGEAEVATF